MLGIKSNVDVISSIQEDPCRFGANKAPYIGVCASSDWDIQGESLNPFPMDIKGWLYLLQSSLWHPAISRHPHPNFTDSRTEARETRNLCGLH